MKKTLSILLSIAMLFTLTAGIDFSAFAGFENSAKPVELNTTYTNYYSKIDSIVSDVISNYSYQSYYFTLPANGTLTIKIEAKSRSYLYYEEDIYKSDDINNAIWIGNHNQNVKYDYNEKLYYNTVSVYLNKGSYYFYKEYCNQMFSDGYYNGSYDITFSFKVDVSKPSNVKVATRNTTSLKISWGKVSGATGYQLQRKTSTGYTGIATTTANYATATGLKAGYAYEFRVRAYRKVNGKYYYSSWRTFKDATRPNGVSLSGLTAYSSGHKIKASWKKVSGYATGYQVMWAKDSSFRNVVGSNYINGQGNVSYTRANFSKGRNYYVRVRAYRTINGTKYYGAWSNVKYVKAK